MFLRGPVPIHLKSVVAYRKNLGKFQIFLAQSIAGSLIGLEGSGHTGNNQLEEVQVVLIPTETNTLDISRLSAI